MDCKSNKPIDLEAKPRHGIEHISGLTKLSNLELQYQMCDADLIEVWIYVIRLSQVVRYAVAPALQLSL